MANSLLTDLDVLLRAIFATPDDDLARLAYADALEEAGDQIQATFVRSNVMPVVWTRIAGHKRVSTPWTDWTADQYAILSLGGVSVLQKIMSLFRAPGLSRLPTDSKVTFRRGFVSRLECPLAAWQEHGRQIAQAHPLEHVKPTDRKPHPIWLGPGKTGYAWYEPVSGADVLIEASVPRGAFELLSGRRALSHKLYDSQDAAHDDLSRVLIQTARE